MAKRPSLITIPGLFPRQNKPTLFPEKKPEKKETALDKIVVKPTNLLGAMQRLEKDFKLSPEQRSQVRNFLYTRQVDKSKDPLSGRITGLEGLKPWEELERFYVPETDYQQAKSALVRKDLSGLVAEHQKFAQARDAGKKSREAQEEAIRQKKAWDSLPFTPDQFAQAAAVGTLVVGKNGRKTELNDAITMLREAGLEQPGYTQSQAEAVQEAQLSPDVFPLERRGGKPIATLPELLSENKGIVSTAFSRLTDEQREGVVGHVRTLPGGKEFAEKFGDELFMAGATKLSDATDDPGAKMLALATTAIVSAPIQAERTRQFIENRDQALKRGEDIPVGQDVLDRLGAGLNYVFAATDMFGGAGAASDIITKVRGLGAKEFAKIGGEDLPTLISKLSDEEIMAAVKETDPFRAASKIDEIQAGAEQPGVTFRPAGAGEQIAKAQGMVGGAGRPVTAYRGEPVAPTSGRYFTTDKGIADGFASIYPVGRTTERSFTFKEPLVLNNGDDIASKAGVSDLLGKRFTTDDLFDVVRDQGYDAVILKNRDGRHTVIDVNAPRHSGSIKTGLGANRVDDAGPMTDLEREATVRGIDLRSPLVRNSSVVRAELAAAKAARDARIAKTKPLGKTAGGSRIGPEDLKDAYLIGRLTLETGVRTFAEWSQGMIDAFGKAIKPHLKAIWTEAKNTATDPVSKFTRAIRDAEKTPRSEQRAYVRGLRKEQAEKGFYAQQEKGQNLPGAFRQAFKSGTKAPGLKLDLTDLTKEDIGGLFDIANAHFEGQVFTQANASFAIEKLLAGKLPEPNQMRLLEQAFGADFAKTLRSKGPLLERVLDNLWEAVNLPRALMASFDFSAPLRQGMILTVANPNDALVAGKSMFKAFANKGFAENLEKELFTRDLYQAGEDAGLHLSHLTGKYSGLSKREEEFMSRFAQYITGPSERAYVTYLNKLRADVFDNLYTQLKNTGMEQSVLDDQAELLASFINKATGRGSLSLGDNLSFERAAPALGALFFAPRYAASRIQFPLESLRGLAVGSPEYKKIVAKQTIPYIAAWSTMIGLTKLHAQVDRSQGRKPTMDVELDPRSSDYGKIRIGPELKTRIDMGAGFQQFVTYFARQATNQTKRGDEVLDLEPGKAFPYTSRFAVSERFLRSKLAPATALLWDAQEGKMYDGRDATIPEELKRNLIPLTVQDLMEAWEEYGPQSLMLFPLSQIGLGVDTYEKKGTQKGEKAEADPYAGMTPEQRERAKRLDEEMAKRKGTESKGK